MAWRLVVLALTVAGCAAPAPSPSASSAPPAISPGVDASAVPPAAGAVDPRKEVRISADDALAAARRITRDPLAEATVSLLEPGALNTTYFVSDDRWSVFVDAFDGRPFLVARLDITTGRGALLTEGAAIGRATAWLVEHGVPVPGVVPEVELIDHGAQQVFEIRWQVRSGQALAPDLREIEVEAVSGEVVRMMDVRRPYEAAPEPLVTAEDAADAARRAAGMPDGVVAEQVLRISFDGAGTQMLIWSVELEAAAGELGAAMVEVDAMTGVPVVTGQG